MKKILLLVTGMSPQIVTETLYGLAVNPSQGKSWIPDEIHVVSTTGGLTQIRASLFKDGHFARLLAEYQLPLISFNEQCLHTIDNENGIALADLKTPSDNEYAANAICEKIRFFTKEADTELHVSIAGGRKTMGFYAGYALSLYGRVQDRMSHVLVSSEFESSREFFYPAPTPQTTFISQSNKHERLDAYDAQVWLAQIPFVRLRHHLPEKTLLHKMTFSEVVQRIALATGDIRLLIDTPNHTVVVNGITCKLALRELAFYTWFAKRAQQNMSRVLMPVEDEFVVDYANDFLAHYQIIKGSMGDTDNVMNTLRKGMDKSFFEQRLTAIRKEFKKAYGSEVTKRLIISTKRDGKGYKLELSPQQIDIK
ncbi:MAG: TIGR02584 family CRISPR-associated protein [Pseudomonadales bacterium]|nr:TIGR02584 family CRISPR-associated protein [Pseudomonadales bacterium]